MSDFLGQLAAQTLGQASSLQPRVPGWFEPVRPGEDDAERSAALVASTPRAPQPGVASTATGSPPAAVPAPAAPAAVERALRRDTPGLLVPQPTTAALRPAAAGLVDGIAARTRQTPHATSAADAPRPRPADQARTEPSAARPPVRREPPAEQGRGAEPAIHVTIGRVEVRAVAPTPPPAVAAPERATPRLSLRAYLRGRTEAS